MSLNPHALFLMDGLLVCFPMMLSPTAEATSLLLFVSDDDEEEQEDEGESGWEDIHEALSNFVLSFVPVPIAEIALASLVHRENQFRSMVAGMKREN